MKLCGLVVDGWKCMRLEGHLGAHQRLSPSGRWIPKQDAEAPRRHGWTPLTVDLPDWALELVAAVVHHEEVHGPADQCYDDLAKSIPSEVRAYAAGWAKGKRR